MPRTDRNRSVRNALTLPLLLCALAPEAAASTETFILADGTTATVQAAQASVQEPDEWNCFDVAIAGYTVRVIMPSNAMGDPDRMAELLRLTKLVLPETLLASTGTIAADHASGVLIIVEFDIFPGTDIPAPTSQMATSGLIKGYDAQQQLVDLGTMWCYDAAGFLTRQAQMGAPIDQKVWLGPVTHSDSTGNLSTNFLGADNTFTGLVKSSGRFRLGGDTYSILDGVRYATDELINASNHQLGPRSQEASYAQASAPQAALDYYMTAAANGNYFATDITIISGTTPGTLETLTGLPVQEGVVYCAGSITIGSNALTANLTLVAEKGVDFAGSNCNFTAHTDDLLAWSLGTTVSEGVSVSGSNNVLEGTHLAHDSRFSIPGSDNDLTGCAAANIVKVTGSDNSMTDGTR